MRAINKQLSRCVETFPEIVGFNLYFFVSEFSALRVIVSNLKWHKSV